MRIITGSARGTKLETLEGESTRPTTDRIKESVFNIIQFEIEGRSFLDLFAGSGQMGLEALSRGAEKALFADDNPEAVAMIKRNAQKTRLYEKCRVLTSDYKTVIRSLAGREKFDIVYLDPPYKSDYLYDALAKLVRAELISDMGVVICETNNDKPVEIDGLDTVKHVKYGKTYISVLRKGCKEDE